MPLPDRLTRNRSVISFLSWKRTCRKLTPMCSSYFPTQDVMIGPNYWMGSGTIRAEGNPGLYLNNSLAEQKANGKIT